MPDRKDLYSENITKIYANLVDIETEDGTVLHFNDSGAEIVFNGVTYMPVAFEVTEPNKDSLEETTGSFSIVGVTQDYIRMIQETEGTIYVYISLVRTDQLAEGQYIIAPTEYIVDNVTISSSKASVTVDLRLGGSLGFYVSVKRYSVTEFPGLSG